MRVQFIPQGLEFDRILAGIRDTQPNKVTIIRNTDEKRIPSTSRTVNELVESISRELQRKRKIYWFLDPKAIDTGSIKTNFFDFADAFFDIFRAVKKEIDKGHSVTLNIASGTKIIAIAMYLVGLLTHSDVFYVIPKEYVRQTAKQYKRTTGVVGIYRLPHLEIKMFEGIPIGVLENIKSRGGHVVGIKSLLGNVTGKEKSAQVKFGKAIDLLAEKGFVVKKTVGRQKEIRITEKGEELLKMAKVFNKHA